MLKTAMIANVMLYYNKNWGSACLLSIIANNFYVGMFVNQI